MGPDDSYLIQYSKSTGIFWAEQRSLALGATFRAPAGGNGTQPATGRMLPEASFSQAVEQGYQASQTWHQGIRHTSKPCATYGMQGPKEKNKCLHAAQISVLCCDACRSLGGG